MSNGYNGLINVRPKNFKFEFGWSGKLKVGDTFCCRENGAFKVIDEDNTYIYLAKYHITRLCVYDGGVVRGLWKIYYIPKNWIIKADNSPNGYVYQVCGARGYTRVGHIGGAKRWREIIHMNLNGTIVAPEFISKTYSLDEDGMAIYR